MLTLWPPCNRRPNAKPGKIIQCEAECFQFRYWFDSSSTTRRVLIPDIGVSPFSLSWLRFRVASAVNFFVESSCWRCNDVSRLYTVFGRKIKVLRIFDTPHSTSHIPYILQPICFVIPRFTSHIPYSTFHRFTEYSTLGILCSHFIFHIPGSTPRVPHSTSRILYSTSRICTRVYFSYRILCSIVRILFKNIPYFAYSVSHIYFISQIPLFELNVLCFSPRFQYLRPVVFDSSY